MSQRTFPRRGFLKAAGLGLAGAGLTAAGLAGGRSSAPPGRTEIRFLQNKPEAVGYFGELVQRYNTSQDRVWVTHDSTQRSALAQFVRGEPPDLACYNYNLESSMFVEQGSLTDLSGIPESRRVDPAYQVLVDQFARYRDEVSALPYSTTVAGVLYNTDLFARAGVGVPTTWTGMLAVCRGLADAGITPIQLTGAEENGWPMTQGLLDYAVGGTVDVAGLITALKAQGADGGPVTFAGTLGQAVDRMVQLAGFTNPDWLSRTYADGNLAIARSEAAMYLQGPWALSSLDEIDPELPLASFALPMTDDPTDRRVRANLDLALWIPRDSPNRDAAEDLLRFLLRPEIIEAYNATNMATSPMVGAATLVEPRLAGLRPYAERGLLYRGFRTYLPESIPVQSYLQEALLTGDGAGFLATLDADWHRLMTRTE